MNHELIDLEETDILRLLNQYNNSDENLSEYPLTDRRFVRTISETVADIIYDSNKKKSLSAKDTRHTFIQLLKTWIEPNSHFIIDESNYNIIVKSLIKDPLIVDTVYTKYGQDFIEASVSPNIKTKDEWKNICESVNKSYMASLENKIKSGLIENWQKIEFDRIDFDFTLQNKTYQNPDTEMLIEILRNLKKNSTDDNIYKCNNLKLKSQSINNTNLESAIQLGYALLNFERNADNEKLLIQIINQISSSKTERGKRFIDHIWTNKESLNFSTHIYTKILKEFKYLLEKQIIILATDVLENLDAENSDYRYQIIIKRSNIPNVLKLCDFNPEICHNIVLIIHKLLALSYFDIRMFKLLRIIENYFHDN